MRSFSVHLVLLMSACGSKIDSGPNNRIQLRPAADVTASGGIGSCTISAPPADLVAQGFTKQNINTLILTSEEGRSKSLCDNLIDMKSTVAIVQFAGVTCLSCQQEAQFFTSKLGSTQVSGNTILHTVALTDLLTDYEESDFVRFMNTFAPQSLRMHDANTVLWRHFSADPNEPTRPTIVAYNRSGWLYVINTEAKTAAEILAKAKLLVEQTPATIPDNSADQQPNTPGAIPRSSPTPQPTTGPTPSPTSAPTKPAAALSSAQNVTLTGGASPETVVSYFGDNNYLIIDLSQYNCTYCRQLASQHQSDARFQAAMQSGKCTTLTVVPSSEISSWQRLYPTSTFAGRTSRGVASESSFARAFSVNFQATPTVFMIDRTGKVLDSAVGEFPAKVASLCY